MQIDMPAAADEEELYSFYRRTITDTFKKNGIDDPQGVIHEVGHQMKTFSTPDDLLMLARLDGKIIGTIAYGKMNKSVSTNIPECLNDLKEIKGVYIHPDYQGEGIGSFLWKKMINTLKNQNVDKVCLDSGYRISQQYWKKKIGEPTFFMKDYWGKGEHQLIWVFHVDDVSV